jgi:hypothetical protein
MNRSARVSGGIAVATFLLEQGLQVGGWTSPALGIALLVLSAGAAWFAFVQWVSFMHLRRWLMGGWVLCVLVGLSVWLGLLPDHSKTPAMRVAGDPASALLPTPSIEKATASLRGAPWSQRTFRIDRKKGGSLKHCHTGVANALGTPTDREFCVDVLVDPVENDEDGPFLKMHLINADFPSFTHQSGIEGVDLGSVRLRNDAGAYIHTVEVDIDLTIERVDFESVSVRLEFRDGSHVRTWNEDHTAYSMFSLGTK